jgi:hypothetical protein
MRTETQVTFNHNGELSQLTEAKLSAEQLAIVLMAEARRMYQRGGTIGPDEHGFRADGDRLAQWASTARELGVRMFKARTAAREMEIKAEEALRKLARVEALQEEWENDRSITSYAACSEEIRRAFYA